MLYVKIKSVILKFMNNKTKKKKGITVDGLAVMVQRGFEDTASKADVMRIDSRLSGIDVRLDRIENLLVS